VIPPDLLSELKAYLGAPAGDTSQDAWLTAQCELVLAAMRRATGRWLYPPVAVVDGFQVPLDPCNPCHPSCGCACPPTQMKEIPVVSLTAVEDNGTARDVTSYVVDPAGILRTAADKRPVPVPGGYLRVEYVAGWAALPVELQAALFDLVGGAYQASGRGMAPGGGGPPPGVSKVSVIDVGSIEYADAGTLPGQPVDPILGRYAVLLAPYQDMASQVGGHPCRVSQVQPVEPAS